MKIAFVTLCLVAAVAAIPLQQQRLRRDVSEIVAEPLNEYLPPASEAAEPQNIYLPPVESVTEPAEPVAEEEVPIAEVNSAVEPEVVEAATEAVPESAVLGENGYEYRTVRKLRFRQRRDVSHLNLGYLPPIANAKLANSYLPPNLDVPEEIPQLKIANEYLPPVNEEVPVEEPTAEAVETEAPETEAPTTEAVATTTEAATTTESAPVESAVFADDGYHYRKPAVLPDLGLLPLVKVAEPDAAPEAVAEPEPVQDTEVIDSEPEPVVEQEPEPVEVSEPVIAAEPERAYLPPLEEGVVEAEGPEGETAALLDDGYHYRVVKRVRLF
ncbi:fibrous sheath CABYR-binding protein [Zeugodacus cucurbitae]|uniref:fibrous sheath CABYR-binding protein n=1 Tax=Zeugodacus cucurbitae TaxID=28588 RepID=UPI0023D96441|nr:fibrous sheath CABYR-binding protein [Zeugodacus cucurbitae]